jgi:hypothetical protein
MYTHPMKPARIAQVIVTILMLSPMALAQRSSPAFNLFEQAVNFVTTQYYQKFEASLNSLKYDIKKYLFSLAVGIVHMCLRKFFVSFP